MAYACAVGECMGTFECMARCGTCTANCPLGCCCKYDPSLDMKCPICPENKPCTPVPECQASGGTCVAACPTGCCCELPQPAPAPTATVTATATEPQQVTAPPAQPTTSLQPALAVQSLAAMLQALMPLMLIAAMAPLLAGAVA